MKMISTQLAGLLGPFESVTVQSDRLSVPGADFDFGAIGTYTVLDELPPGPTAEYDYDGSDYVLKPLSDETIAAMIAERLLKIDADADAIRKAVVGERATEYQRAYEQASDFKTAGYEGDVPAGVKSWQDAKGWTAQEAADDIIDTGLAWLTAEDAIRAARLLRKEQVKGCTAKADFDTVMAAWDAFTKGIRTSLGV